MKDLVKGFIRWLIIVLLVLNALVYWGIISAHCQEKEQLHRAQHKDRLEQEDESGWMFIVVTGKMDNTVYFRREGTKEVKLSSMVWDKDSVIQDKTKVPFTGCYLALYCRKHLYLYVIQRQPCVENQTPLIFRDQ